MSSGDNSGNGAENLPGIEQPRGPRNLQDLLRYAVQAGENSNSAQNNNVDGPLDPEGRRFLEEALKSMTVDAAQYLSESIDILKTIGDESSEHTTEDYQDALQNISEAVDNIDTANDFFKLGGFEIAFPVLASAQDELRWRMAGILGQCTQNNPFCQNQVVSMNLMPQLLMLADRDPNPTVKTKAVFAVASTVRDCPEALKQFIDCDGFSVILKGMQSENEALCVKSTFFISTLTSKNPQIKGDLFNMGYVEQLIILIRGQHSRNHEYLTLALLNLINNYIEAQDECKRPEFELKMTLQNILDEYGQDEAFEEETANIKTLMTILFTDDNEEER